jgi:ubiquinone biosynthesis protein Coq4
MRSPDLSHEMLDGLRETLADWDYRATVAFAHLFMEIGDTDALEGYDAHTLASPVAQQMLEERYLSPDPDVEWLSSLPENTMGHAYARYYIENDLDPNLLRESAFIEAHKKRGEDVGYLAQRGFQLHDLFHVLTGYDTSPLGEVRVVSFTVAQTMAPYPALIIATRPLQAALYKPQLLPVLMDAITEGWTLGRRAAPLLPVHWEEHFERPLAELRTEYGLGPQKP